MTELTSIEIAEVQSKPVESKTFRENEPEKVLNQNDPNVKRFLFLAKKLGDDIDGRETIGFRVLGIPISLVEELAAISRKLGIDEHNQPLIVENSQPFLIRNALRDAIKTNNELPTIAEGRCYSASPYGDAFNDVLWRWIPESDDWSEMRLETEPDERWQRFMETAKKNLAEWIEHVNAISSLVDVPILDGSEIDETEPSTIVGDESKKTELRENQSVPLANEDSRSRMPQILEAFTNAGMDDRLTKVEQIATSALTVEEKLFQIHLVMPIPCASCRKIGAMVGASHTAVRKTAWWIKNCKEARERDSEARLQRHRDKSEYLRLPEE